MEETQKELKTKIFTCYWSCFYYFKEEFDQIMAQRCIEILFLEDKLACDFNYSAMQLYNLYLQEPMVYEDQMMERDSVLASMAWWYFHKEEMDSLIQALPQ